MERWLTKALCGFLMLVTTLLCFLLPVKLTTSFQTLGEDGKYYLDLLNCFAGGVFFAAYLMFMAPAVRELLFVNLMLPYNIDYPLPDLLIGVGFFVLVLVNKVVVSCCQANNSEEDENENSNEVRQRSQGPCECSCRLAIQERVVSSSNRNLPSITESKNNNEVIYTFEFASDVRSAPNSPDALVPEGTLSKHGSIADIANQDSMVRSVVLMLALSVDSVLEGVTTGLKTTNVEVWAIFISNTIHEAVISFCLGLQLIKAYKKTRPVIIAAVAYSLMNPVGLLVATAVFELLEASAMMDLFNGLFQALTSGCFIYVTFCEILEGQITNKMSYGKIIAAFSGFVLLAAFAAVPGSTSYSTNASCEDIVAVNVTGSLVDNMMQ